MTITNGYSTLAELKAFGLPNAGTNAGDDAVIESMIESASREIDDICRRHFYAATTTRYFTPGDSRLLFVDDISTATGLTIYTDDDGDATYENTWAATDYRLEPINAVNGWPFTMISLSPLGNYSFPLVSQGIKITGSFGWAAVPKPIHEACMLMVVAEYRMRYGEAVGDSATITGAGIIMTPGGIPKSALKKIQPYTRLV